VVLGLLKKERGFDTQVLVKEELLLADPSKHPFAVKEKVYLANLDKERFILVKDGQLRLAKFVGFLPPAAIYL